MTILLNGSKYLQALWLMVMVLAIGYSSHVASLSFWYGLLAHSAHFLTVTLWTGILIHVSWFSDAGKMGKNPAVVYTTCHFIFDSHSYKRHQSNDFRG